MTNTRRVLVVDDEPDLCELLSVYLTRCGHDVCAVPWSDVAISIAAEFRPETVVTNLQLRGSVDERELVRQLRSTDIRPQVLAMSGESLDEAADRSARESDIPVLQQTLHLGALFGVLQSQSRTAAFAGTTTIEASFVVS